MQSRAKQVFIYLLIVLSLVSTHARSQPRDAEKASRIKYQKLSDAFLLHNADTAIALQTALLWLKTAKSDGNKKEQVAAYQAFMHSVKKEYRMIYADSLLSTALETADNSTIGSAYLTIGTAYYSQKNNTVALEQYVKAATYIAKTNDEYLSNKIKYAIAQTNYHLGYYDEAIALFISCIDYFKNQNEVGYVKALHGLALCYHYSGRYDLSSYNNQLGIKISEETNQEEMIPYFKNSEGFNKYMLKEYSQSLELLTLSLPTISTRKDYTNHALTLLYIGKCWLKSQDERKAKDYFIAVDQLITEKQIAHPYLLENYELLVAYFKKNNATALQLKYSDKLIEFETILKKEYKYLTYKIHKEGSIKNLKDKARLNATVHEQAVSNIYLTYIIVTLLITGSTLIFIYFIRTKRRKEQQNEVALEDSDQADLSDSDVLQKISPQNLQSILIALEQFEKGKKFIAKGYSLVLLADALVTNTRYTSAVIFHYRKKKIPQYLNDLKIDYLLNVLKVDPTYRNFTYEALGESVGFGSTQSFTKAFKEKMGKSPIEFINETIKNRKD